MIPQKLTKPYVAICEGKADVDTFARLVRKRSIRNLSFVCADSSCAGFGKDYFFQVLNGLTVLRGFDRLKGIMIIQDSDDDPSNALREIGNQVKKANRAEELPENKFSRPSELLKPSFSVNRPPILAVTIPWIDRTGCLETLVLPSVEQTYPAILECLEDYSRCTGNVLQWSASKQAKMRLASLIAAICKKDPTCAIQNMWSKEEFKDLLDHESFDQIDELFRNKRRYFARTNK